MTEFDALLKRSFAEASEPADDGFSVSVGGAVARRERLAQLYGALIAFGLGLAALAVVYGLYVFAVVYGQDVVANAGLEMARTHGILSGASSSAALPAQGMLQSLGMGLSQLMLIAATLAGGAVAYRYTQD